MTNKKRIAVIAAILMTAGTFSVLSPIMKPVEGLTHHESQEAFVYPSAFEDYLGKDADYPFVNMKLLAIEEKGREIQEERERQEREAARLAEIERITSENNRKDSVTFNPYNLLEPSNMSGEEFYQVLLNAPRDTLADHAWDFIAAEETYGVNAFFIAALVAQESLWGTSERAQYQNNMTGHAVFSRSAAGTFFSSKHENIMVTTELIKNNYLTPTGKYYGGGFGTSDVNVRYCLDGNGNTDYKWSANINSIAKGFSNTYHSKIKSYEDLPN